MAARSHHPGGEDNTVEAQMIQAASVLHQGQFLDRNAQQWVAMLDKLLTHKEELSENADVGGSLGSSDYKVAKLKILREVRKINRQIETLAHRRADFVF